MMRILFILFLLLGAIKMQAQTYPMNAANNGQTFVTCSGTFTDDGGATGQYSNNINNRTITFCTANPGELLRFDFTSFNTENNYDILEVFNGPTATGIPAATYMGNIGPQIFISNQPGGCVTFRFNSDGSSTYAGWVAQISCVEPCVAPTAVLADNTTEEICSSQADVPGDLTVSFDASGSFSNDGFTISAYEWNWGDGTTSTTTTAVTTHTFPDDPGIYTVTLKVRTNNTGTDPDGCLSSNTAVKLVMVLPPPNFEGITEGPIEIDCGESVELTGIASSQIITQEPPPNVGSEISLPDGDGVSYYSYLDLTGYFPPGATLSADCFPEIMIELEHSFAGDLWIDLIAPTGEEVRLFNGYGPFGGEKFGWCVNGADNQQPGCVAPYHIVNSGGINWGAAAGYTGTTQTCDVYSGTCESGQYFLQDGTFNSSESFNNLVGAELNGVWVLKISDEWALDDGFISSWSISFPGDCYSDLETETPILDGGLWTHTGTGPAVPTGQTVLDEPFLPLGIDPCPGDADCTGNQLSNTITVGPFNSSGNFIYEFTVTDEFGCTFTKEVEVIVAGIDTEFDEIDTEYCLNEEPQVLPTTSANGVEGTWSPAVIDTSEVGGSTTYTFTPNAGLCGSVYQIEVTILDLLATTFAPIQQEYCQFETATALPETSQEGYTGTWDPAIINTDEFGTQTYTFTPNDLCAAPFEIDITIIEKLTPTFLDFELICQNTTAPALPGTSENGISGTWIPAVIDTSLPPDDYEYEFTPNADECAFPVTVTITITEEQLVEIVLPNSYCQGEEPDNLPTTLDNGVTGTWIPATIDTTTPGTDVYTFYPDTGQCALETPFTIEIFAQPILNTVPTIELCDEDFDGLFTTNLTDLNADLGGGAGITYVYYGSLADFNSDNPIPAGQWNNYTFPSLPATIYVVGESGEGCRSVEIPVQFIEGEAVNHNAGPFGPIEYCPENTVDLTQFEGAIGAGTATLVYYNNLDDARNQTNAIQNATEFTPGETQTSVIVRLDEVDFCSAFVEILLERLATPSLELSHATMILCEDDSFEATATSDDPAATFEWTLEDGTILSGPIQTINQIGTHTIIAYSAGGCRSEERTLVVSLPSTPVIDGLEMGDNYVIVNATNNGEGPLEYSLDGVLWQSSPQFNNLIPGETYTIWVRSSGCMIEKYEVTLLSIPNLISPNGDGKNDTWTIRGIEVTPGATVKIFDRYGKIFVDTNFEGNYEWNGKYLGNNVPSGDYWYIIQIPSDGIIQERKFVGHISVRNK